MEKEGGCIGHGHAEVVSVRTLDKEVMHNPLTTIGEILLQVASLGYFSSKSTKINLLSKRDTAPIISTSSPASSCLIRRAGAGARVGGTGTAGISLASSGSPAVVGSLRKENNGEFPVQLEEESTHTIRQDLSYLELLWQASLVRSK